MVDLTWATGLEILLPVDGRIQLTKGAGVSRRIQEVSKAMPGGTATRKQDPVQAELEILLAAVERARRRLPDQVSWQPGLEVLAGELQEGEPFFFKFAFASSMMSSSDTPVVSE